MKKLLFILSLCLSVFATAQCPVGNLTQNAKWKFVFSQCMQDTLILTYADTSKIAYIDGNGNLTTITYAALLDSLNITETTGPDSTVAYYGSGGTLTGDSNNFAWDGNSLYVLNKNNSTTSVGALVITGAASSLSRVYHQVSTNSAIQSPTYQFMRSIGTLASPSAPVLGTRLGDINFGGYNGSSWIGSNTSIRAVSGGIWTSSAQPSFFSFSTTDGSANTFTSFLTKKGTWSILGSENDTNYSLTVNGTAAITQTPTSTNGTDSIFVKDPTTGQLKVTLLASMLDTITAPTVTGSDAFSAINVNQTWNTSGTPSVFRINLTDNASGGTSTFAEFKTGGVSMFSVRKNGIVTTASQMIIGGNMTVPAGDRYGWSGRSNITSPSDGTITLNNSIASDFNRLQFGGTTSSFPSIKRNGTGLQTRLADDSGYAPLEAGTTTINSVLTLTPITATAASALTPTLGMLVVVSNTNATFTSIGLWFYNGSAWTFIA